MSRTPGSIRHAGLAAGVCTDEVLAELGYSPDEIDELREQGAVGGMPMPLLATAV
jgi:crotonobetainyl-CoA:carnitine CoA-transferase CaiB-like acyl-CoA transferase